MKSYGRIVDFWFHSGQGMCYSRHRHGDNLCRSDWGRSPDKRKGVSDMKCCAYCGTKHEPAEDAACGCGCGSEPMGCGSCMREGGPVRRYGADGSRLARSRSFTRDMLDDASDYDGWND
jgi:hypothetical protein